MFSGHSGVGKSTLVNAIEPDLDLKTKEISMQHMQGQHTTTFAEMHQIKDGYIIDTPGIKGFGLDGINKLNLSEFFPEMKAVKRNCKFNNCTHTHEPDCAVIEALEKGKIDFERYESYLNLYESQ